MTSTDMTADELRDLAARTYRTCVARQARIAKRDEEARRAHAAILERCDEVERELRELRSALTLEKARWHTQQAARGLRGYAESPLAAPIVDAAPSLDESVRDADVVERSFYNQDRAAWSERAKRAESQLALAMAWGAELADAARCEASLRWRWEARADEARRALSIAETKSAGPDVIVADAEARRVAAETRAIQAEGRAERLERELAEARRGYDTVTAALEGGTGDPLAHALRRAEKAERENAELRDQASAYNKLAERFRAAEARARAAENRAPERERVSVVERRAAIDGATHEVILGAPGRGCLITTPDHAATAMVLADFLESLGHDVERVEADEPASLATPIVSPGLDELVREAGADAAERAQRAKPSEPSETVTITLLKEGDRVTANRGSRREPGTITKVERAGPDGWRCSIFFDEGSGVSWYGPREVAPLAPEHDPRNRTEDE